MPNCAIGVPHERFFHQNTFIALYPWPFPSDFQVLHLDLQILKVMTIENVVSYLTESLQKRSSDFGDTAEALVTERLQQLGPVTFRERLQRRTQEPLDWIASSM